MMPRKSTRTSFERIERHQKLSIEDARKIRACVKELPNMVGLTATLAEVYGVSSGTINRIRKNLLHRE